MKKIAVLGLGYVGLPLAVLCASKGWSTIGYDTSQKLVDSIEQGKLNGLNVSSEELLGLIEQKAFHPTSFEEELAAAEVYIICVPTPLTGDKQPDLSYVISAAKTISRYLSPGNLVVLESTTYPGTTTEVLIPVLEESGLVEGRDFYTAYSPEREDPGNKTYKTADIPKVVGSDSPEGLRRTVEFYSSVMTSVVTVSSTRAAEAAKILENVFRAVNISLVNELKTIFSKLDIDIWEVIEAAKTKPFGFMPFYPGPGMGGHCIPVDPFYLAYRARQVGVPTEFIELAGSINDKIALWVASKLFENMPRKTRPKVLVLGVAYKKNVSDTRESPAYRVIKKLSESGAKVSFFDTHVPILQFDNLEEMRSIDLKIEPLNSYDGAILLTDHDAFDLEYFATQLPLIVDTRNAFATVSSINCRIIKA